MPLPIDPSNGKVIIIGYYPKIWLSVLGIAVFGVLTVAYVWRYFRTARGKYMLWTAIGSLMMTLGFIVRIPMHNDPTSIPIYTVQTLLILLSPCAFIAQDYYVLPHMASWLETNDCLYLRPAWIGRIFLTSDVITFLVQLGGSGMAAEQSLAATGEKIALAGLIIQLISFALFILLLLRFGYLVHKKHPEKWSLASTYGRYTRRGWLDDWRTVYFATVWTTIGIMIRCVFRVIEFAQGYDGVLRTTEGYFYLLDSLPVALAICVWVVVWPPHVLRNGTAARAHEVEGRIEAVKMQPQHQVYGQHIAHAV